MDKWMIGDIVSWMIGWIHGEKTWEGMGGRDDEGKGFSSGQLTIRPDSVHYWGRGVVRRDEDDRVDEQKRTRYD